LAFEYGQTTWGNGELSSRVDMVGAKEAVQAEGVHKHIIYIENAKENSRLDSIYRLNASKHEDTANATNKTPKKYGDIAPNSYMFSLNRIDSIWHQAEVHSMGDISSTSTAIYGPAGASTDLDVSAQEGTIEERVESYWDYRMGLPIHGHPIVQTFTNGSMGIRSHLKDDTVLQYGMSDADILEKSLESVELYGETARQELAMSKTELSANGVVIDIKTEYPDGNFSEEKMNSLLLNKSLEENPKFLDESVALLSIAANDSIAGPSNEDGSNDMDVSGGNREDSNEREKLGILSNEALPERLNSCSINSTNESNNCSSNLSNAPDGSWDDSDEPLEPENLGPQTPPLENTASPIEEIHQDDETFVRLNLWPAVEKKLNLTLNKTRESYRLGGIQQRLGTAFVGRKVRQDSYFSEEKVPLNNIARKEANMTRSAVLTDIGRLL